MRAGLGIRVWTVEWRVFIDLGVFKWLVEQPVGFGVAGGLGNMQQLTLTKANKVAVAVAVAVAAAEMRKMVSKFGEGGIGGLLGHAT